MINIVICTSQRLNYLVNTINDLVKFSSIIDKIIIFSFNDNFSSNMIKKRFSNKFKNITTINGKSNHHLEDRIKTISSIDYDLIKNTKYIWFLGDKDRITTNKFLSIKKILKKNISGLTLNTISLKKNVYHKDNQNLNAKYFKLDKGIHKLGLISSQIINTRLFLKYSKQTRLSAYYLGEIVLKIINFENNWYFLKQKIIGYNHVNNEDKFPYKLDVKYIDYRIEQEFKFYIQTIRNILIDKDEKYKKKIILRAFVKNIISWISLLKEEDDSKLFRDKIKKYKHYYNNYLSIKIIIIFITYSPLFLIKVLKKIK